MKMNDYTPGNGVREILRFWHQVEFFIPFDLEQVVQAHDADWAVQRCPQAALQRGDRLLWRPSLPPGRALTGFDVYIGVFDKSLLVEVTRQALQANLSPEERWEQEERAGLEGLTCMAKFQAGLLGEPLLDSVSVSTAPWALGRIQHSKGQLTALDFDAFQNGIEDLKDALIEFRRTRVDRRVPHPDAPADSNASTRPQPLSSEELLALLSIFETWTGFQPEAVRDGMPAIVIHARSAEESRKKRSAPQATLWTAGLEDEEDGDDAGKATDDIDVEILNSFFAKDIAWALASVEQGTSGRALQAYLAPVPAERRLDLYSEQGRAAILRMLAPAHLPAAHWLDEPAHAMSLMQQFAINNIFDRLQEGGIFSVNGPPGTGKTTLLRDVFAELVTRRARVLAGLARAGDAFAGTVAVDFQGEGRCLVSRLREDLTGFEMVVASSNNAAVENLSRDLPKAKALGKAGKSPWRDAQGNSTVGYLKPVAHNIAARTDKGDYMKLDADDAPWGLIACALGNKRNRSNFAFRLAADARRADKPVKHFDPALHQSLWTWREKYEGPGFAEARTRFTALDTALRERLALLDRYAQSCAVLRGQTRDVFCAQADVRLEQALQAYHGAAAGLAGLEREQALCTGQLVSLREEAALIEQSRPAWWLRWLKRARERTAQQELADNRREQRDWLVRQRAAAATQREAEERLREAVGEQARARQDLAVREAEWNGLQRDHATLAAAFPGMAAPSSAAVLEEDDWQISGLWHDEQTNHLRSALFAAALTLHEAWLAEVLRKGGGFGSNAVAVTQLLGGKQLQQREHALTIWQSLFMIVPVISSTFASVASQFRDLGPDSLGWLFIDEAGQAVPQAAVGALWRARRAVVVGDPLQIEPVFTVPIKLIDALARTARLDPAQPVEPHLVSVQGLADEANAMGASIDAQGSAKWIGSPLRVHRRCVDPMFTIANQIAYDGKMIFFDPHNPAARLPPADSFDLGASAWVDIGGTAQDKQVVPEQVALVRQAIVDLVLRTGELPALYVISPFRRIKQALSRALLDSGAWPDGAQPATRLLREWCRARIGTVHTFQGKEESMVWLVLGCDADTRAAAAWAAGKPNLFNVALTRAKHRFFLIGDTAVWAGLPHFAEASAARLPRIRPDVFLQRVRSAGTRTSSAPGPRA